QAASQAPERKLPQLILGYTEHLGGVAVARKLERLRDMGQHFAERLADRVSLLRRPADGLPQEPHAVADMPGLVEVDLGIAGNESGQELVLVEVVGDELERGEA